MFKIKNTAAFSAHLIYQMYTVVSYFYFKQLYIIVLIILHYFQIIKNLRSCFYLHFKIINKIKLSILRTQVLNFHISQRCHHHGFDGVHTVFCLVKHHAGIAFKHVFGYLYAIHTKCLENPFTYFCIAVVERR